MFVSWSKAFKKTYNALSEVITAFQLGDSVYRTLVFFTFLARLPCLLIALLVPCMPA